MSFLSRYAYGLADWYAPARAGIWLQNYAFGRQAMKNTQASLSAQMAYDQYLKMGNERALRDWHKNVSNRRIAYPELSYAGQIYRANTSISRAGFDYSTADANYWGNLPYRSAGLYGIASRLTRSL